MNNIYMAVIEDNNDPEMLGRCRIRVLGIHTENKNVGKDSGIPTEDLPLANPVLPIVGGGQTGIGGFKPPTNGTWVYVSPMDNGLQRWVYFGVVSGFPVDVANTSLGFNDPSGVHPLDDRIGEPDINRLSRNDQIEKTVIDVRIKEVVKNITIAALVMPGTTINAMQTPIPVNVKYTEPREPYAAEYPYNFVFESEPKDWKWGHIIEIDDTPGKERIHFEHKSGTAISIHPSGQRVDKIFHDSYSLLLRNDFKYVHYDQFLTIWGDQRLQVRSNRQSEIYGYDRKYVKGHEVTYISGDKSEWIGADLVTNPEKPTIDIQSRKRDGSKTQLEEKNVPEISAIGGNKNLKIENNRVDYTKGNEHKTIDGTLYIEVTGLRNLIQNQVGDPGAITFEPHGEFMVKGHKMSRIKGGKLYRDYGCVTKASICPYSISYHTFVSRTVKASE